MLQPVPLNHHKRLQEHCDRLQEHCDRLQGHSADTMSLYVHGAMLPAHVGSNQSGARSAFNVLCNCVLQTASECTCICCKRCFVACTAVYVYITGCKTPDQQVLPFGAVQRHSNVCHLLPGTKAILLLHWLTYAALLLHVCCSCLRSVCTDRSLLICIWRSVMSSDACATRQGQGTCLQGLITWAGRQGPLAASCLYP